MRNLWKAVEDWRSYNRQCRELEQLSDRELNVLGISRTDIPAVIRGERRISR